MIKSLLFPLRSFVGVLVGVFLLLSCETDSDNAEPFPLAGPTTSQFSLADSVKVDSYFQSSSPELHRKYQDRTYKVDSNKLEAYYYEENNGITLYFKDTSGVKERSWVTIHFKNRTLLNLPATHSLTDTDVVCVQNGQSFEDGSSALSPSCIQPLHGTITLAYDATTKVLTGEVKNLRLPLEYYVPDYSFPNLAGNVFKASGSSRTLNISFQNVKSVKMQ